MAIPKIKATYSLDVETTQILEATARRWGVSKSEALTRAIRLAGSAQPEEAKNSTLRALDRLQRSLGLDRIAADEWVAAVNSERRATAEKRKTGAP